MTLAEIGTKPHHATRMTSSTTSSIDPGLVLPLFGPQDQHLRRLCERFNVAITHRHGEIRITGDDTDIKLAADAVGRLKTVAARRGRITPEEFIQIVASVTGESVDSSPSSQPASGLKVGQEVRPRTPGQTRYANAILEHDVVFAIGPAGTGKTYLAVAMAVNALKQKLIRKIVLVRPAVEAGESLGYLPGDMHAKINPYLRPLLDALQEMIGYEQARKLMEHDVIEVVPLAYMRGRTLNDAFIILDEAQNTTSSQMKMFLTRMGANSKIVVSGDTTQTDLPNQIKSGLKDATARLGKIEGISVVYLATEDIVRHPLVQRIVDAYDH